MKGVFENYIKMIKCGFFNLSISFSLINILFIAIFSYIVPNTFVTYSVCSFILFAILCMIINEISENRYALYSKLPIKNQTIVKIIYVHIYTLFLLGFICCIAISAFSVNITPLFSSVFILINLLFWNLFMPCFSSPRLKLGLDEQIGLGFLLGFLLIILLLLSVISCMAQVHLKLQYTQNFITHYSIVSIILVLVILFTAKISYKISLKKIMNVI